VLGHVAGPLAGWPYREAACVFIKFFAVAHSKGSTQKTDHLWSTECSSSGRRLRVPKGESGALRVLPVHPRTEKYGGDIFRSTPAIRLNKAGLNVRPSVRPYVRTLRTHEFHVPLFYAAEVFDAVLTTMYSTESIVTVP